MKKEIIRTDGAPAAIGPYSQGVRLGTFVFTSGQMGLVPGTTKLAGDHIESQARRALENLKAVLVASRSSLGQAQKTTVFIVDPQDITGLDAVYAEYFPERPPAGSTVQVAALPMGGCVQIEAVARDAQESIEQELEARDSWGVGGDQLVYTSGQMGLIPGSTQFVGEDIESQTRQTLENLRAELEAKGSCLEHVLKTIVFLADVKEFARMNGVYGEFFRDLPPARATVQPAALPMGSRVQIEAVAYRED